MKITQHGIFKTTTFEGTFKDLKKLDKKQQKEEVEFIERIQSVLPTITITIVLSTILILALVWIFEKIF